MSEFSDSFKELIRVKDINVYSMVQYCNTDRSTMYKYISGKRKLKDFPLFKKISEFMRLSPKEHQDFLRAYHISNVGEYKYYCRRNVEDFILDFPENLTPHRPSEKNYAPLPEHPQEELCFPLHSQMAVNSHLYWMIHQESNVLHGHLGLLLQPEYEFLFQLLASLRPSQGPMKIEHLLCLDNTGQMTNSKKIRSLSYMEQILPLFFAGLDYHPYYFYDDINAHFYNLSTFPCWLLTSTGALMCSSDFRQGILFQDPDVLSFLWKVFEDIRKKTSPLFHVVTSVLDECKTLGNMGWALSPSYGIQAEPCLLPYISPEILERVIYKELPEREALIADLQEYLTDCRARTSSPNIHVYHTRQGIMHFLETGRLQEIPEDIYAPFSLEERYQMLGSMVQHVATGIHRMLKGPLEDLPLNLHLSFTAYNGYILFSDHAGRNIYLIIKESGMLSAFMDYVSHLDESRVCTPEETAACIYELAKGYKAPCKILQDRLY